MKNIAVLFSGQPRMIKESSKFLKQFFDFRSEGINTDYFFHLWDSLDTKTPQENGNVVVRNAEHFSHENLESLVRDLYNPVFIEIDNQNTDPKFLDLQTKLKNTFPLENERNEAFNNILKNGWFQHFTNEGMSSRFNIYLGQFESASRVSKQVPIFEKKLNKKYDICIRMRTDMVFTRFKMDVSEKAENLINLFNKINHHRHRGLINPVLVTYSHAWNGTPLIGDHYFVGDGQSISHFHKNASLAVLSYFKKLFKIGMSEGFQVPDVSTWREIKNKNGHYQAHRAILDPAEASWAHLAFINQTTILAPAKPFMEHVLLRSDITAEDSMEDIKLKVKTCRKKDMSKTKLILKKSFKKDASNPYVILKKYKKYYKFISKNKKFIWHDVPKNASTSIRSFLVLEIDDFKSFGADWHAPVINETELLYTNKDYFSFAFSRNPWDRMVSNYFMFNREDDGSKRLREAYKEAYGVKYDDEISCFKSFCLNLDKLISKPRIKRPMLLNHLLPQTEFIENDVDFIGKFESLQESFDIVRDKIGISGKALPCKNKTNHKHYTEYYDDETRQIVAEKYAKDLERFNYKFGE